MTDDGRLADALAAIDALNAEDPNVVEVDGERRAKEVVHAELATAWVRRLDPDASPEQLLAARAHHLRRWASPRRAFPEGRAGYLRWRAAAKKTHAEEVAGVLRAVGYDESAVARVQAIIRKEGLATDPAVQVHEDALCLVFLETQLDDVAGQLGDERAVEVLRRTAAKMSGAGLAAAAALPLSAHGRVLLEQALGAPEEGG